jgi:Family of unknown function (DUF5691)
MNESERSGLFVMRDCWIGGGPAADLAPSEWEDVVAAAPAADRERLLLAIAGQALDVGFRPAVPKTLTRRAPLPRLALPALPEALRPLFRAALKQAGDAQGRKWVAALAAARGFVAHPLDWMPAASDLDAPPAYAPWVDWLAQGDGKPARPLEELTPDNWDDFYPAGRRLALAAIRRFDPAKARALLEAKVAGEAAEVRLALIELLRVNLGPDDVPYLQSLSADRSGKVKQLAARLLARVGQHASGEDVASDVAELAGFVEAGRAGWLRWRTVYAPKELKSSAQIQRRAELFEKCQLIDLAGKLEATEEELIAGWQLGGKDHRADYAFACMVVASGSDAAVAQLAERLHDAGDVASLSQLLPRLDGNFKRAFVKVALATGIEAFAAPFEAVEPGTFGREDLMRSDRYTQMRKFIVGEEEPGGRSWNLSAYGLLATAPAAAAIIEDLVAAGLTFAHPSLALLRLNAALADTRPEETKT